MHLTSRQVQVQLQEDRLEVKSLTGQSLAPFSHQWPPRAPKHPRFRCLSFQEGREPLFPPDGRWAPRPRVSCSNLAGSAHHLLESSEANIHNAQLFWWLPEQKGA